MAKRASPRTGLSQPSACAARKRIGDVARHGGHGPIAGQARELGRIGAAKRAQDQALCLELTGFMAVSVAAAGPAVNPRAEQWGQTQRRCLTSGCDGQEV